MMHDMILEIKSSLPLLNIFSNLEYMDDNGIHSEPLKDINFIKELVYERMKLGEKLFLVLLTQHTTQGPFKIAKYIMSKFTDVSKFYDPVAMFDNICVEEIIFDETDDVENDFIITVTIPLYYIDILSGSLVLENGGELSYIDNDRYGYIDKEELEKQLRAGKNLYMISVKTALDSIVYFSPMMVLTAKPKDEVMDIIYTEELSKYEIIITEIVL